jgi:hypothetical protein
MNPELERLVQEAMANFDALTLAEKREPRRAQTISWVIGEMLLEHPEMSREEAERVFDEVTQ